MASPLVTLGGKSDPNKTPESVTTGPFPASTKVYLEGKNGVRVPVREIALSPTRMGGGKDAKTTPNAPLRVYDTSGPYTDPNVIVDVRRGVAAIRRDWILGRG